MRWSTALMVRGVIAVIFGILALVWPEATVLALAVLFGAFALVDGVGSLMGAFDRHGGPGHRTMHVVVGVAGIALGILTLLWPGVTAVVLALLIGAWAVATGVGEVYTAWRLRERLSQPWLLAAVGVLSVIAGILLLVWPGPGAVAIATIIGAYAIVTGVLLLFAGWRLRRGVADAGAYATSA